MSESTKQSQGSLARIGLALAIAASVSACATGTNPRDPLEGYNRAMFKFNDTVDTGRHGLQDGHAIVRANGCGQLLRQLVRCVERREQLAARQG